MMKGIKRLLGSSRAQFGVISIIATCIVMFVKWPVAPEGVTDPEILKEVLAMQTELLGTVGTVIGVIAGVVVGGTTLEDAAKKLFGRDAGSSTTPDSQ